MTVVTPPIRVEIWAKGMRFIRLDPERMATSPVPPRPLWQTVTSEASTGYMRGRQVQEGLGKAGRDVHAADQQDSHGVVGVGRDGSCSASEAYLSRVGFRERDDVAVVTLDPVVSDGSEVEVFHQDKVLAGRHIQCSAAESVIG